MICSHHVIILFFLGEFNFKLKEPNLQNFLNAYKLKNRIEEKTCFRNPGNPCCIDLNLFKYRKASKKQQFLRQDCRTA